MNAFEELTFFKMRITSILILCILDSPGRDAGGLKNLCGLMGCSFSRPERKGLINLFAVLKALGGRMKTRVLGPVGALKEGAEGRPLRLGFDAHHAPAVF